MKCVLALVVVALVFSPAFAQAKKAAPAASADDGEKVVQLDEQLADIVVKDKNDCDKMAAGIKSFVDKNGKEMQRLREEGMKRTPDQRAEFQKKYGARIHAATTRMNVGIGQCIQNPKVKDALSALNSGGSPPAPRH
jgi:hypothetical protein